MGEPAKDNGSGLLGDALLAAIEAAVERAVVRAVREARSDSDNLLTLEEAAALLNVKKTWVAESARRGTIPAMKTGHYWRFDKRALLKFLEQNKNSRR